MGKAARTLRRWERRLLQRVFHFDAWHVGHAGEAYAADIVQHLNAWSDADRGSVVEIGCGLGDILRRLRFRDRLGLDRDAGALAAARFLARMGGAGSARFEAFEFPRTPLTGVYNAIIMVNWIHEVDPDTLRRAIHAYTAAHLRPGGGLVLDTVDDPAYAYRHDIRELAPTGATIAHLGEYARGRHIWMVR
jgi:SAM-dependent methyltransferase